MYPYLCFVSAYENLLSDEFCKDSDDYISKPIDRSKLDKIFTKYL